MKYKCKAYSRAHSYIALIMISYPRARTLRVILDMMLVMDSAASHDSSTI